MDFNYLSYDIREDSVRHYKKMERYREVRRELREKLRPLWEAARDCERSVDKAIRINAR